MDVHTISEESYKRGFEAGYVRGVCDHVAEALKGAIKWNDGIPKQDMPVCYVCQTNQDGSFTIRPAVYKKNSGVYLIEDYTEDGSYVLRRVAEEDIRLWAEVTIPFSTRFTFSPPTP